MKEVEEGDFFELRSHKQKQAFELVVKNIKKGTKNKGLIVEQLNQELYDQRQECKTFLRNLEKSCNHEIHSKFDEVILGSQTKVTVQ